MLLYLSCCLTSIKEGFKDLIIFVLVLKAMLKQYSPKKLISFLSFVLCLVVEFGSQLQNKNFHLLVTKHKSISNNRNRGKQSVILYMLSNIITLKEHIKVYILMRHTLHQSYFCLWRLEVQHDLEVVLHHSNIFKYSYAKQT